MDPGGSGITYKYSSAEFYKGEHISGKRKSRMCAGIELLFLSGGSRCLPDRRISGSGRRIKISFFLLYKWIFNFARRADGAFHMRILMSFRLVSRSAAQDPLQKVFHKEVKASSLDQIYRTLTHGHPVTGFSCK